MAEARGVKSTKAPVRTTLFGRKMVRTFERTPGKGRSHRSITEKLRKYEVRAEGHEFIPALMHIVERYLAKLPKEALNEMDRRFADAMDRIPEARTTLEAALAKHREIPREVKGRAFSSRYLDMKTDQGIDAVEIAGIMQRAKSFVNATVVDLSRVGTQTGRLPDGPKDCCCPPQVPPGQPSPPNPKPPNSYEITFTKLYCVDESDPEWWGSDEPYAVFGVITESMAEAGVSAWAFHTPVYEDVDDGDTRPASGDENLRLYGYVGPTPISSPMLITTACWENDLGDVSATTGAMRTALTSVATTAAGAGGVVGWIVAGAAVIVIGITYLVDLIGADDQIDSVIPLTLAEAQADSLTAAVNPSVFAPLHFDGGDADGIYDVYLKLRRA